MFKDSQLKQIVKAKAEANETELRFKYPQATLLELYARCQSLPLRGRSTTVILLGPNDMRRESFYEGGVKKRQEDIQKTTIIAFYLTKDLKFTMSKEQPIGTFDARQATMVKFKYRLSYDYNLGHIDVTCVRLIDIKSTDLKGQIQRCLNLASTYDTDLGALCKEGFTFEMEYELNPGVDVATTGVASMEAVIEFLGLDDRHQNALRRVADILGQGGVMDVSLKRITVNPRMLDRRAFEEIHKSTDQFAKDYMVMEKTDGYRCLVILSPGSIEIVTERELRTILKDTETSATPITVVHAQGTTITVFDGELSGVSVKVFDLLIDGNKDVLHAWNDYDKRINRARELINQFNLDKHGIGLKTILPASPENIMQIYGSMDVNMDGLIFNARHGPNFESTKHGLAVYKWKPAELITFDFLIVPMPWLGVKPFVTENGENLYILMCGCDMRRWRTLNMRVFPKYMDLRNKYNLHNENGDYQPVPFQVTSWPESYIYRSRETHPLSVGEFHLTNKAWELVKIREDKTTLIGKGVYGNDYFIAMQHYHELQNPLTIGDLVQIKQGGQYFKRDKPKEYKAMIQFNGFVKYNIMKILRGMDHVLDIASGKGQDIFIYNGIGVGMTTFVEPDHAATIELASRLQNLDKPQFYVHTDMPRKFMRHEVINQSFEEFSKNPKGCYDAVVCNFAIHYILKESASYEQFADFCHRVGAQVVILTCFDADVLRKYLPLKNARYDIHAKELIYVKHHFSDEYYPEHPVNNGMLIKSMGRHYTLLARDSFGQYLRYRQLDPLDAQYSSFYQYFIFRAKKC